MKVTTVKAIFIIIASNNNNNNNNNEKEQDTVRCEEHKTDVVQSQKVFTCVLSSLTGKHLDP
jgi:hypothetical protein